MFKFIRNRTDQPGIAGYSVILQSFQIPFHSLASHRGIPLLRRENRDLPMPHINQVLCSLIAFSHIIHRDMGKSAGILIFKNRPYGAQYKGYSDLSQFSPGMIVVGSQKNDPFQTLFLDQFQRNRHLVLLIIHMLKDHRQLILFHFFIKNFNHGIEQRIGNTLDQNRHRIGFRTFQISCAVIRYISVLFNHLLDLLSRLRVDIRMIIDCPGHRADTNTADSGYIFNRNL